MIRVTPRALPPRLASLLLLSALGPLAAPGCAATASSSRDALIATLWVQTAAEYEVAVRQSYQLALRQLDAALAAGPAAPAIVVDLDETLVDNSAFEARLLREDQEFDLDAWFRWLDGGEGRALPGAVEFVTAVRRRGVAVYMVTNRPARFRAGTLAMLRKAGLIDASDDGARLLLHGDRPEWTADKTSRREYVASQHALLLLVGNDLNDFANAAELDPAARRVLAASHADRFGHDWILVPSPAWGTWLDAVEEYRDDPTPDERRALRLKALRVD